MLIAVTSYQASNQSAQPTGDGQSSYADAWVYLIRLDNCPNEDLNPFDRGDFYCECTLIDPEGGAATGCKSSKSMEGICQHPMPKKYRMFNQMVRLDTPSAAHTIQNTPLRVTLMDEDLITADDNCGSFVLEPTYMMQVVNTDARMEKDFVSNDGQKSTISLKLFSGVMAEAITVLHSFKEAKVVMAVLQSVFIYPLPSLSYSSQSTAAS